MLDQTPGAKVKRILVNPGHRLSLQSHQHRDEHWVVVRGVAEITLDNTVAQFGYGESVIIKRCTKHRLSCVGNEPTEIIEVQTGNSCSEDDIVRYEDDYGS